jgi:ribosomal protein S1
MSSKGNQFDDTFDDALQQATGMSDADVERLMSGTSAGPAGAASAGVESLEPGTRVDGVVVDHRGGEILVELDGKTLGVIDELEFSGGSPPPAGEKIQAQFEHYDRSKGHAILSVGGVRKEIFWEELRRGAVFEGTVTAVNKGGLTLDIKGTRAFMPVSQIERQRVQVLEPYIGKRLRCEVTDFDAVAQNLIVSRRAILEQEAAVERVDTLARIVEGEIRGGKVMRITTHGAFVDIGGMDGLVPATKIHAQLKAGTLAKPLEEGQEIQVQVVRVDRERERVSLDIKQVESEAWGHAIEGYSVGEELTGWLSRRTATEIAVSIDEGIEGVIPQELHYLLGADVQPGAILKVVIVAIDEEKRLVLLRPAAAS